jgi:hypothetical protein
MRIAKDNIASGIGMHYERAKYWIHQFGPVGVLLGRYLRKNCASRTEVFMGIPVYYIQSQNDLSLGSSLLKDSASLLNPAATRRTWRKQDEPGVLMGSGG